MKILVIGPLAFTKKQLGGQVVKTRSIYQLLVEHSEYLFELDYIDTTVLGVFALVRKLFTCDKVVFMLSHNGMRFLFPLIFLIGKTTHKQLHYFVVGGWLAKWLGNKPIIRYMLKKIDGIYPQTQCLCADLINQYSFSNVIVYNNFRYFDFEANPTYPGDKLKLVFMARVEKMKGLDWIFNLAKWLKDNHNDRISISFYGPIKAEDKAYFEEYVDKYDFVEYCGALNPEKIHKILCKYDVMLLPTHYFTEGLPGSIVDAYISGIPVVATEWQAAREFVDDGKSGIIIPFDNGQDALVEAVLSMDKDRDALFEMKKNALQKSKDFGPEVAWERIKTILFKDEKNTVSC